MKRLIKRFWLAITGVFVGAVSGFLYWKYVGCVSGSCSITSKPLNSTLYFSVLGGLLFSIFQKKREAEIKAEEKE